MSQAPFDGPWEPFEDVYEGWDGSGSEPDLFWVSDALIEFQLRPKLEQVQRDYQTPCWEWTGARIPCGYGQISIKGKRYSIHRVVYAFFHGGVADGLVIDHLCRNRICGNPAHLEAVTVRENTRRGNDARRGEAVALD